MRRSERRKWPTCSGCSTDSAVFLQHAALSTGNCPGRLRVNRYLIAMSASRPLSLNCGSQIKSTLSATSEVGTIALRGASNEGRFQSGPDEQWGEWMKIFLTGGTGFIGQALVRSIRKRGWELQVLVRDPESAPARWIAKQNASLVRGDVTSRQGLEQAVTGTDVLVHNAGVYEFGADSDAAKRMQTVNVEGTQNMLAAAKAAGVARTIYVSTVWALGPSGRPPSPSIERDETQSHDGGTLLRTSGAKPKLTKWRYAGGRKGCLSPSLCPMVWWAPTTTRRSVTSSDSRCSAPCCLSDLAVTPF